ASSSPPSSPVTLEFVRSNEPGSSSRTAVSHWNCPLIGCPTSRAVRRPPWSTISSMTNAMLQQTSGTAGSPFRSPRRLLAARRRRMFGRSYARLSGPSRWRTRACGRRSEASNPEELQRVEDRLELEIEIVLGAGTDGHADHVLAGLRVESDASLP